MPTQRLSMRRIQAVADDALWRRREQPGRSGGSWASRRARCASIWAGPAAAGIGWPLAADVTDESLVARLFVNAGVRAGRALPRRARLGGAGAGAQAPWRQPAGACGTSIGRSIRKATPIAGSASCSASSSGGCRRRCARQHVAGRQSVRGLLRQARADRRSGYRRGAHGGDLRRRARRLQPHLCRGDLDADVAGLDRRPRAHVPLLWRGSASAGAGQSQERHQQGVVLRPRGEPQLCGDGGALQRRHSASPAEQPAGQGCGRSRRPLRADLYPRPAAQRHVLLLGRVQRRHRRAPWSG